jgi:hypothetical protein
MTQFNRSADASVFPAATALRRSAYTSSQHTQLCQSTVYVPDPRLTQTKDWNSLSKAACKEPSTVMSPPRPARLPTGVQHATPGGATGTGAHYCCGVVPHQHAAGILWQAIEWLPEDMPCNVMWSPACNAVRQEFKRV